MDRWNWFLAADFQGNWITTNGYAEVSLESDKLDASLRHSPDTDVYHHVSGIVDSESGIEALVLSPGRDIASFELQGCLYRGPVVDGVETKTIVLTDGSTVLGLSFGPCSGLANL